MCDATRYQLDHGGAPLKYGLNIMLLILSIRFTELEVSFSKYILLVKFINFCGMLADRPIFLYSYSYFLYRLDINKVYELERQIKQLQIIIIIKRSELRWPSG